MTRGNQRELARKKNAKKQADLNKGKSKDGAMSKEQRMTRDADIMRQKQLAKQKRDEEKSGAGTSK